MGVIKVYAGHEFKFECKIMKKQIRARNTSDAGSTSSWGYKFMQIPIFFFCSCLLTYLV